MFSLFLGQSHRNWSAIPSYGAAGGLLIAWKSDIFDHMAVEYGTYSLSVNLKRKN